MNIPFLSFGETNKLIKSEITAYFETFFDRARYVLGEDVSRFEKEYAAYNQVNHCVGLSNGLDALILALKTLNVGPEDEVIVPSNTYIASVLAVSYVGAIPIFVEPDLNSYNIDPKKIEAAITKKTKAIMPVHLYGQCCNMDAIMAIAKKHNLFVVEDNAQSQGSSFNGQLSGSFGHINGTSFYPGKNLGAFGDAGAVTTNDEQLARKASVLRNYGSEKKYHNEIQGHNMRLDECQAGFLSIKLKHLEMWTSQRQQIAVEYYKNLKGIEQIILPSVAEGATHVYHLFVIRTNDRDALQQHLDSKHIGTMIHYPIPPHLQPAYQDLGFSKGAFPIAENIAETCLSLPLWPGMSNEMVEYISEAIKTYYAGK